MTCRRVLLWGVLLAVLAIPALGAQAALDCAGWNTEEYFQTATVEDVTACLDAGVDVAARTDDYRITPLHWAAGSSENPALVEVLLAAGADVAARNDYGATLLHRAAQKNENPAVIEVLLNAGASVDARDEDGNTLLHSAAELVSDFGDLHGGDAIEALLDAGANPAARNAAGETPWDLAKENEALKGSDAYWRLNDARFDAPGPGAHRAAHHFVGSATGRHCTAAATTGTGVRDSWLSDAVQRADPGAELGWFERRFPAMRLRAPGGRGAVCDCYGQLFHARANHRETPGNQGGLRQARCLTVAGYPDVSMPGWPQAITHAPDRWPGLEGLREAITGRVKAG